MPKQNKRLIIFLILITSLFWGLSFLATSLLVERLDPVQIQAVRWPIAAALFMSFMLAGKIHIDWHKPKAKLIPVLGMVDPCLYMIFESYGIAHTSSSIGAVFVATIPCFVLLAEILFLHRRSNGRSVASILLAFVGVTICTVLAPGFSFGNGDAQGYVFMIIAVLFGAAYSLLSDTLSTDYSAIEITAGMSFVGTVFFTVLNAVMGYGLDTYAVFISDKRIFLGLLFLGVCCSALCYMAFNYVLGHAGASIGNNLISSLTTITGVVAGILIANDPCGIFTIIGVALTITGVVIATGQLN